MEEQAKKAQGAAGGGGDSEEKTDLLEQAKTMKWVFDSKEQIKQSTAELIDLVQGKLDIPQDTMAIGKFLMAYKSLTPVEIVQHVIDKYGFADEKKAKAEAREASVEAQITCPANALLYLAFKELAGLYFKEKNGNAGASFTKASTAIKEMPFEVTIENAMSLTKGKSKVANIGKKSGEYMKEFCETGKIQKLEEKRLDAA